MRVYLIILHIKIYHKKYSNNLKIRLAYNCEFYISLQAELENLIFRTFTIT